MAFVRGKSQLESRLRSLGYPVSFGGWDFKHWNCADLRQAIQIFDRYAQLQPRKFELCRQLCDLKPSGLTQAEQEEVSRIRAQRQADRVLQDRSYALSFTEPPRGKKRVRSDSPESESTEEERGQPETTTRSYFFYPVDQRSLASLRPWHSAPHVWNSPATAVKNTPLTRECQACIETKYEDEFPTLTRDFQCQHQICITCITCFATHIEARSGTSALNAIPCPEPNCVATLSYTQMKLYASPGTFNRYDSFLNQQALKELPDYHPCANPICSSGGFADAASASYMICADCGTSTCITCNTIWHPGLSHEENVERLRQEEAEDRERNAQLAMQEARTKRVLSLNSKVCPNESCGVRLMKAGGCDHMTCRVCNYEFCWLCLADYDAIRQHGNHMHAGTCLYYRPLPKPKVAAKRGKRRAEPDGAGRRRG